MNSILTLLSNIASFIEMDYQSDALNSIDPIYLWTQYETCLKDFGFVIAPNGSLVVDW